MSGVARAQAGHSRSSKTSRATLEPLGGRNTDVSPAQARAAESGKIASTIDLSAFRFIPSGPRWRRQSGRLTICSLLSVKEWTGGSLAGKRKHKEKAEQKGSRED